MKPNMHSTPVKTPCYVVRNGEGKYLCVNVEQFNTDWRYLSDIGNKVTETPKGRYIDYSPWQLCTYTNTKDARYWSKGGEVVPW